MDNRIRQVNRIQRWVDRLREACNGGALSSAVVEAESLEAEVRRTRELLCCELEECCGVKQAASPWRLRAVTVAVAALFFVAVPVSPEADRVPDMGVPMAEGDFEWVTPDEKAVLRDLRRVLSENSAGKVIQRSDSIPQAVAAPRVTPTVPVTPVSPPVTKQKPQDKKPPEPAPEAVIGAEDVMSLIQIGQRAMTSDRGAVVVERQ